MRRTSPRAGLVLVALTLTALFVMVNAAVAAARPWLGVYTQEITGDLRDGMNLHDSGGVLVNRVVQGGPADRAGIRNGDVIVQFDLRTVDSPQDLARMVGDARDGQGVAVQVLRHGERRTITVTLADRSDDDNDTPSMAPTPPDAPDAPDAPVAPVPGTDDEHGDRGHRDVHVKIYRNGGGSGDSDDDAPQVYRWNGDLNQLPDHVRKTLRDLPGLDGNGGLQALRMMGGARGRLGVHIQSLNADLAAALDAPGSDGVLVLDVMSDTPAEKAGLRSGDVILSVNGQDVKGAEDLVKAIGDVGGKVTLTVARKGERRTVEAELAAAPKKMMLHGDGSMQGPGRRGEIDREDHPRDRDDANSGDLRQQVDELRQQLRELRRQLEDQRHE